MGTQELIPFVSDVTEMECPKCGRALDAATAKHHSYGSGAVGGRGAHLWLQCGKCGYADIRMRCADDSGVPVPADETYPVMLLCRNCKAEFGPISVPKGTEALALLESDDNRKDMKCPVCGCHEGIDVDRIGTCRLRDGEVIPDSDLTRRCRAVSGGAGIKV